MRVTFLFPLAIVAGAVGCGFTLDAEALEKNTSAGFETSTATHLRLNKDVLDDVVITGGAEKFKPMFEPSNGGLRTT